MMYDQAQSLASDTAATLPPAYTPDENVPCNRIAGAPGRSGLVVLVLDSVSGHPVPNVSLTVTRAGDASSMAASRTDTTDSQGLALFVPLPPATYEVRLGALAEGLTSALPAAVTQQVAAGGCACCIVRVPLLPWLEIVTLTPWFNPYGETCDVTWCADALGGHGSMEVHATGYFEAVSVTSRGQQIQVERPCGTSGNAPLAQDTCVYRADAAIGGSGSLGWDGVSQATRGVLAPAPGSGDAAAPRINARCAPYTVMLRHHLEPADGDAQVTLDPFYPQWVLQPDDTYAVNPQSCRIKWRLTGTGTDKLSRGRLLLIDRNGAIVWKLALDRAAIKAGLYDPLTGSAPWKPAAADRDRMPLRVQIQLDTGRHEPAWLALAAMHTQVPQYDYRRVQLIGFDINNGIYKEAYRGEADPEVDIDRRCELMIEALRLAYDHADPASDVLKVFMAPEFYFRGRDGAYSIEQAAGILPRLRAESDRYRYRHWLFVFGTAVARFQPTSEHDHAILPGEPANEIVNVALVQQGWYAPALHQHERGELLVYKEYLAVGDFVRVPGRGPWTEAANREVKFGATPGRVQPTLGSRDTGLSPSSSSLSSSSAAATSSAARAGLPERNISGLGGGCVFTLHGVTYGLEVCLDHKNHRLWDFYQPGGGVQRGDPLVQVQLIPSEGMSIGGTEPGKEVAACADGVVLNVDATATQSVATVADRSWSCEQHPCQPGASGETCIASVPVQPRSKGAHKGKYWCITCSKSYDQACELPNHQPKCEMRYKQIGRGIPVHATAAVDCGTAGACFAGPGKVVVFGIEQLPAATTFKPPGTSTASSSQ